MGSDLNGRGQQVRLEGLGLELGRGRFSIHKV